MNEIPNKLREDNVLRFKIILLTIYCVFTVAIIIVTNGSADTLYSQLILQLGSILNDTAPVKVQS